MQVVAMYLFPLLIGIAVTDDVYTDWSLGYFGQVAELVGGPALALAVTCAAAVSQVGMFEAEMSADSYQVCSAIRKFVNVLMPSTATVRVGSMHTSTTFSLCIITVLCSNTKHQYAGARHGRKGVSATSFCPQKPLRHSTGRDPAEQPWDLHDASVRLHAHSRDAECYLLPSRAARVCCVSVAEDLTAKPPP